MARIFKSPKKYKGKDCFIWLEHTDDTGNEGKVVKQQYHKGNNVFVDIPKKEWQMVHSTDIRRMLRSQI